jgi:flavin-dependent dehydrogenase
MLDAAMADNPALAARLQDLTQVSDRFEAISQVSLASKSAFDGDVCMIGDAAGMIAPLCGDGMAMALRSAELAAPHVDRFLRGRTSASAFRRRYRWAWRRDFGVRMTVGRTAHAAAFRMQWASALVRACRWCPPLAQGLIRATRG